MALTIDQIKQLIGDLVIAQKELLLENDRFKGVIEDLGKRLKEKNEPKPTQNQSA